MLERLLITGALMALFVAAIALGRRWYAARNRRIESRMRAQSPAPVGGSDGDEEPVTVAPRIVYFTTKTCVVCKAQQEPAMAVVVERVADVRIERHDAIESRELADEYGVLSVPTTAVYDRSGQLVTINRGFTPASVLYAQVEGREPSLDGGAVMSSESLN